MAHSGSQRLDRPYEPTHIVGYAYDGTRSNRSDLLIDGDAQHLHRQRQRGHRELRPAVRHGAGVQGPDGHLRRAVRQHRGRRDQHRHQGGDEPLPRLGLLLRRAGEPRPPTTISARPGARSASTAPRRGPGFHVTGPVRIPGLYDGKDKTFFSIGYERIKDERPRFDATGAQWVPTEALRRGDFSAYAPNVTIYDPLTRVPVPGSPGNFAGQPFPGNVIPANRISPVARAILEYYSLPKSPGLGGNIFDSTLTEVADYDTSTVRLDQQVSRNNKMFVRGSWYKRDSNYNEYFGNTAADGTLFQFISYQAMIDDVHVFSPTTVLNVRYGWNRFERNSGQQPDASSNFDLTRLGFPAEYNALVPDEFRRFPRLDFDGDNMVDVAYGGDFRPTTSHTAAATLNKSLNSHLLRGRRGDEDLPRGQPLHRQRHQRRIHVHQRLHPAEQRHRRRLQRPAGLRRLPPRAAQHHDDPARPRTTPNIRRPGASSCRTTGGSTTS